MELYTSKAYSLRNINVGAAALQLRCHVTLLCDSVTKRAQAPLGLVSSWGWVDNTTVLLTSPHLN